MPNKNAGQTPKWLTEGVAQATLKVRKMTPEELEASKAQSKPVDKFTVPPKQRAVYQKTNPFAHWSVAEYEFICWDTTGGSTKSDRR